MTMPNYDNHHHNHHLSFPFHIAKDGRTAQVSSLEEHVKDELIQLMLTNKGERLCLPEFGGGARGLVFENVDETTIIMRKADISQAISRWLGHRITLEELIVELENELINIEIKYRIAGSEDTRVMKLQRGVGG